MARRERRQVLAGLEASKESIILLAPEASRGRGPPQARTYRMVSDSVEQIEIATKRRMIYSGCMPKISFYKMSTHEYFAALKAYGAKRAALAKEKRHAAKQARQVERETNGYYEKQKERNREKARIARSSEENKRKDRERKKNKYAAMSEGEKRRWRDRENARLRRWYHENGKEKKPRGIEYRLVTRLRNRMRRVMRSKSTRDKHSALLGCTGKQLRKHLESQFKGWMNWSNYGTVWVIDHILPCASFDLEDVQQRRTCFHFTNLRPLGRKQNAYKAAKITDPQYPLRLSSWH